MTLVALLTSYVQADSWTGNALLAKCGPVAKEDYSNTANTGVCLGFVKGVVDGYGFAWSVGFMSGEKADGADQETINRKWTKAMRTGQANGFCVGNGQTLGQYVRIFVKYLRAHPKKTNQSASTLLIQSLNEAFPPPCK